MRLLVSGTREDDDLVEVETLMALEHVLTFHRRRDENLDVIILGRAQGVDTFVENWAINQGVRVIGESANWDLFGKSAGVRRNEELFKHNPTFFLGVPGPNSKGTWDAAKRAASKHIPGLVWPGLLDNWTG